MDETSSHPRGTDDPIERVREYVINLGRKAERLFDYYDFGFPRAAVREHIERLAHDLGALQGGFDMPELASGRLRSLWDHEQSVRYAAGAAMITARFRRSMTTANAARALAAKALHEFQADLLDDLIDEGGYSFEEARAAYRLCLAAMTDPEFDAPRFRHELARGAEANQRRIIDLLASLTVRLRDLLVSSPNWAGLRPQLREANDRLAVAQPLTMFQTEASRDIAMIRRLAAGFPAPHPDLTWHERFARSVAHGTGLALIDLCFSEERLTPSELKAHLDAWYYFDIILTMVNNVLDVPKDANRGLVSLALIAMKESEALEAGRDPRTVRLTMRDYEPLLARLAEFSLRAITTARDAVDDPDDFYPFLALMIPVVMLADPDGAGDDLLQAYLRALAPAIRDACRATSGVFPATTPRGTRSGRPYFSRIASSLLCP